MNKQAPNIQDVELKLVGSSTFGRYPKISQEQTYNMIISDGWLVPYAGYQNVKEIIVDGKGRGIFASTVYNHLIVVIDNEVFQVDQFFVGGKIGELETYVGDVYIDENNAHQIAFCDGKDIWIFDYVASTFTKATLTFTPSYISFQDGYFISGEKGTSLWRLSSLNNGLSWPYDAQHIGSLQTKPDNVQACVRLPGKGNHLLVMGENVTELWVDLGYRLFPYQRTTAFNIDYGCVSASTIASGDTFVVWLGFNEKSGPAIMYSSGSDVQQISTDGINFKFASLKHPEESTGFLFKQDGHLLYQLTFYNKEDNYSLVYDFNTAKFFTLCDPDMNYHIARRVAFFNTHYFFISLNDGKLYELDTSFTDSDSRETPRIRVCNNVRLNDSSMFLVNNLTFTLEQGDIDWDVKPDEYLRLLEDGGIRLLENGFFRLLELHTVNTTFEHIDPENPRIDLTTSSDGGETFGNSLGILLHKPGMRKNRLSVYQLGYCNDFVAQFRFWGFGRFVVNDGLVRIAQ